MDTQSGLSVEQRAKAAADGAGGLKLVFKGSTVKHLLSSGGKRQGSWRQDGGSELQEAGSPSQGGGALSDSPGHPFSPSSAEPSPHVPAGAPARGGSAPPASRPPRSLHSQPPGKQPYPDDCTPEAEAARAQVQPLHGAEPGGTPLPAAAMGDAAAGPRSVHAQPPGKQPHPDDPAFAPAAAAGGIEQQQQQSVQGKPASQPPEPDGPGVDDVPGARSVLGRPPGKQPYQISQIEAAAGAGADLGGEVEEPDGWPLSASLPQAPWRRQQTVSPAGPAALPAPAVPAGSGQVRQRPPPPAASPMGSADRAAGSRKRPASQGEGGQRKKAANGGVGSPVGAAAAPRPFSSGVPGSLARAGEGPAQIRPIPGAPRSLQQRQQLVNGVMGGGRTPAGAPRPKQPPGAAGGSASKPKQPSSKAGGSSQRRASGGGGGAGGAAAAAAAAAAYSTGDVVWAKIGNYPWWPARLLRPSADEHYKPKHAPTDLFCVFYGSNDYNWLPATALKPFSDTHPDYVRHAGVKNKALQRAIDEAWVFGMQRQRPDVTFAGV